jgi:mannan endo-1,4-beta-mannosidase
VATVDAKATAETKALFQNLQNMTKDGAKTTLFGMEAALSEGFFQLKSDGTVNWSAADTMKSDARTLTGKGPAVVGYDIASIVGDWWEPSDASFTSLKDEAKARFREEMRAQYGRGGINTMAWHMANPMSGKADSYRSDPKELWRIAPAATCTQMTAQGLSVPNCGSHFSVFQSRVGELADWVLTVKDTNNVAIPIIFRAFHENNGDWFWWGAGTMEGGTASARYQASLKGIWAWMVDYLTNTKGVHQLLFASSPNGTGGWTPMSQAYYLSHLPDLSLVDVLGYDFYSEGKLTSANDSWEGGAIPELQMITSLAKANGKIAAMTEGGYTGGYQGQLLTANGSTVKLLADPSSCKAGGKLDKWWSEKQVGPLAALGGVAYYYTWFSRVNPSGCEVYGPVPGTCTGTDFVLAWTNHQLLLEGEGEGGVAKSYYVP